ncbi:MAG: TatD family hydrolase [Thermofilaceae archaeon]
MHARRAPPDAHVHLHEFERKDVEEFVSSGMVLVAVSDDYESSLRTLDLRDSYPESIVACVGVHPWQVPEDGVPASTLEAVADLVRDADCVGEVGLDLKFVPKTFSAQVPVLRRLAEEAARLGKPLNVHAAGAWREALDLLLEVGRVSAIFHWYTGPEELLPLLRERGCLVTVNPALRVQKKLREIAAKLPEELILLESDGPYDYRGLKLTPRMVPKLLEELARLRGTPPDALLTTVWKNFTRVFPRYGVEPL